jgi:hypothetical protein
VCKLMGECEIAAGSTCNITASNTATGSLSLCTVEGVEGGVSAFPTAGSSAQAPCQTDGECAAGSGSTCDTSSTHSVCTCADGVDRCKQFGQCVSHCDSPQVKQNLLEVSQQVMACDPFSPAGCAGGLVCEASSAGVQLVCNSGGVTAVEVGGVCLPERRSIQSARFSADGRQLLLTLNAAARSTACSCGSLFSSDAMKLAWCVVSDRVVRVDLGSAATVLPGDALELRATQTTLVDKLQPTVPFRGSMVVESCNDCTPPFATVVGPQVCTYGTSSLADVIAVMLSVNSKLVGPSRRPWC